jgi:UDP-2,4-diacetamido-2,4,6-trideoxy-beta-L-altropyranose hydrolase
MNKVLIRVDASLQIGTGHVMRCLTLAHALQKKGHEVSFVCREHEGHLTQKISTEGFEVFSLPSSKRLNESSSLEHAHWLGEDWKKDAVQTLEVMESLSPELLIVDHYALDVEWEKKLRGKVSKIFVIDDLADREHDCDFLLDQTYGRECCDYEKLVPTFCQLLLGSEYALLRPEFYEWRERSLERRERPTLKNILVSMGGVDPDNYTESVLSSLARSNLNTNITVTVVLGKNSPHINKVREFAAKMPFDTQVLTEVNNMAEIMTYSDLAIGASGATTWERCCLGLPTLSIILAENQKTIARNLERVGAQRVVEAEKVEDLLKSLTVNNLKKMAFAAAQLVDGKGAGRIYSNVIGNFEQKIEIMKVVPSDCTFLFQVQQRKNIRKYFKNKEAPTWEEHCLWFDRVLSDTKRELYKMIIGHDVVGTVRLDEIDSTTPVVSIIVLPEFSGQGIARKTIGIFIKKRKLDRLMAIVNVRNKASRNMFEKAGFCLTRFLDDDFGEYIYDKSMVLKNE